MGKPSYPPNAKHPALIILNALLLDMTIIADGNTYRMMEDKNGSKVLCMECAAFIGDKKQPDPHYIGQDMTIGEFIKFCEDIPWSDIFLIGCSAAMTSENKKKWRKREKAQAEKASKQEGKSSSAHKTG